MTTTSGKSSRQRGVANHIEFYSNAKTTTKVQTKAVKNYNKATKSA
jgi:hypothetical protein